MNLLDHIVVEVTSKPHKLYEKWCVKVKAKCYGSIYDTSVMFQSYEDACQVGIGYKFLA